MYHVPLTLCIYGGENGDEEEVRERRLPGFLYADDLVLCGKSKEDLRAMVGHFVEVCKVNPGKKMVGRGQSVKFA